MTSGSDPPDEPVEGSESPSPAAFAEPADLRRRAYVGVLSIFSWNYVSLFVAFLGNLVLARLLTPADFGIVAVGTTVSLLAIALTEGGLGSRLIQRPEAPSEAELRTLTGVQLSTTGVATVLIIICALPFGVVGQVTALMVTALPIGALQTAGRTLLIRNLRVSSLAATDVAGLFRSTHGRYPRCYSASASGAMHQERSHGP